MLLVLVEHMEFEAGLLVCTVRAKGASEGPRVATLVALVFGEVPLVAVHFITSQAPVLALSVLG